MKKKITIDNRWNGTGGIGTFSYEINKINNYPDAGFSGKPYSPFDTIKTAIKIIKKNSAVVFFPGYIPPFFSRIPYVFTIHDLNHLDRKENSSWIKRFFYKSVIKRGCHKSKYIFTVSNFSKERIIDWSGVDAEKVINVGNGVSSDFSPNGEHLDYPFEFFLCVSNRKLHKNEIRTLESFKVSSLPIATKLVFTGEPNQIILQKIQELNLSERVVFTGFIKNEELPKLYRSANALIFISLYEGFGLPVVEAMASGIPVITSKTTSLGEVAGDAALLVDPLDTKEIAAAFSDVYYNRQIRAELIDKGLERAKCFTWEAVAEKVRLFLEK
ncbi:MULTISPECIES: glycosyltransferase family 4 protein [Pectobacterium]|uniref:glycosyltransferase family 4 protein n=1 Tax=Pectobacterium TaxID=122277 RepID=UPI00094A8896|nr:glycosyltransferase family 1 protein [Pectobacterium brasiliense]APS29378.1 glycosyl transferase family 1 [Pectobacterium brasiliense]